MPEMHLREPRFTYSACRPFTKNIERIQKFKETGDSKYIYQNELDKACFQHDMAYGDFKDLPRTTATGRALPDKAFNIIPTSMVYKFFDKKKAGRAVQNEIMQNNELAEKLQKTIIRKFEKQKMHSSDNIWGADLADMQLLSKFNKGIRFLLCVIDICSKYGWVIPLKYKKCITRTNAFQKY